MSDIVSKAETVSSPHFDPDEPEVGRWYWVSSGGDEDGGKYRWLGCVMHVGSNYAELEGIRGANTESDDSKYNVDSCCRDRVHFDAWKKRCTWEPNVKDVIRQGVARQQARLAELMGAVQEEMAKLSLAPGRALSAPEETAALALHDGGKSVAAYKSALVKAKEETLPKLFERIETVNKKLANWMKAEAIPLYAQARQAGGVLERVEGRIFNIELYAGLVEKAEQLREGAPAPQGTKLHLFQRRHYMDEECLRAYDAGGMQLHELEKFDAWLARQDNFERILPHPRSLVAFRVRRETHETERGWGRQRSTVRIQLPYGRVGEVEADKLTFIYIRNGAQLFRVSTAIEFPEQLFPDTAHALLFATGAGQLYAKETKSDYNHHTRQHVKRYAIATEGDVQTRQQAYEEALAEYEVEHAAWEAEKEAAKAAVRAAKTDKERAAATVALNRRWYGPHKPSNAAAGFKPFNDKTVYYDDIRRSLQKQMDEHNRLVLVLQGLFDRSPVLHPHAPAQLWTAEGFEAALALVYDTSRAIPPGPPPDFEAFRARLNANIKAGTHVVGQEDFWERKMAEKEALRLANSSSYRDRDKEPPVWFRPEGDPGPGLVAAPSKVDGRGALFAWEFDKERSWQALECERREKWIGESKQQTHVHLARSIRVPLDKLLNVEAYTPGDYKPFAEDPRTRAEYLTWAPLCFAAEDWHAEQKKQPSPVADKKKRTKDEED